MRFGIFTGLAGQTWQGVVDLWRHLEATGWDIACVSDHLVPGNPTREGTPGCRASAWASSFSATPFRHPAVLAKMAAQIDIISGGRLVVRAVPGGRSGGRGAGGRRTENGGSVN